MQAVDIRRDRRCRMNENISGIVESLNVDKKLFNVTLIDEAPKKLKPVPFVARLNPSATPLRPDTEKDKKDCASAL